MFFAEEKLTQENVNDTFCDKNASGTHKMRHIIAKMRPEKLCVIEKVIFYNLKGLV